MKKVIIIFLTIMFLGMGLLIGIWFSVDLNTVMKEMFNRLSTRINGDIILGGIEAGTPGKVILRGIKIRKDQKEVIDIPEVQVHLSLADLFRFKTTLKSLVFRNPRILLEHENKRWNLSDIQQFEKDEEDQGSLKNIISTKTKTTSISGLTVDRLKVQGGKIVVSQNDKKLLLRAELDGRLVNGTLYLDSWIVAMENESVVQGRGKAQFHAKLANFMEIGGTLQADDVENILEFLDLGRKVTLLESTSIAGSIGFKEEQFKPNLELKLSPIRSDDFSKYFKVDGSSWKIIGDLVEGSALVETPIGKLDTKTKMNLVQKVIRSEVRSAVETKIGGIFLRTDLSSTISAKGSEERKWQVNGVASFDNGKIDHKIQDQAELLFKLEYDSKDQNLEVLRAVLDFPKTGGRIETSGKLPLTASRAKAPQMKFNVRDFQLDKFIPGNGNFPPIKLARLIATIENGVAKIESGTGHIGPGRFHLKGVLPSMNGSGPISGLRLHLEKIPLDSFDPRLVEFTLDSLDLSPDSKLNSSLSHTSGTKIAVGATLNQSSSPLKDLLIMGQVHPHTLNSLLPQISTTSSKPLNLSIQGSDITSLELTLNGYALTILIIDEIKEFKFSDLKQKFHWNADQESLTIHEGKGLVFGGNLFWDGDLKVSPPFQNSLKLEASSIPVDKLLGHFAPSMASHFMGQVNATMDNIKFYEKDSGLALTSSIIGTIKSPEYLYHQPIFDFLNSVKNGLGSNLVKDLLQREIQAKSSEQKNGVILKDIVDIKTQLNDASLSIEPFTIEEYRDEFELRFSALEISFPLKKELEGSIRGSVILSLSADFLKKNLPLKSDFKQSFTRELVFNGPLTMPLSRASLDSFRNDLIALVATQMDMKTLEIDLKAKVKSIESEAKDVFKSFINGTSDKKLEKLKDTREAFKGLLKGLIKPNPKSTDLK